MAKKLKEVLANFLTPSDLSLLIRGYDVLGNVVIVIIPKELEGIEKEIAAAIIDSQQNVRVVAKRVGNYAGEFRTISLKKIGGQGKLSTVHKEFGVKLHVDPEKVYFSPRSGNERYRLAKCVQPGEHVLVMFSGIAPLPLMIGLHSKARAIVGIEKNPVAHHLGLQNLKANKKVQNITLLQGDVLDIASNLAPGFDRIAMPLPVSAANFLDEALGLLKKTGWLHFYDFQKPSDFGCTVDFLSSICSAAGRKIAEVDIHKCGHISPGRYRICADVLVVMGGSANSG